MSDKVAAGVYKELLKKGELYAWSQSMIDAFRLLAERMPLQLEFQYLMHEAAFYPIFSVPPSARLRVRKGIATSTDMR
jgi:hypothetical protein